MRSLQIVAKLRSARARFVLSLLGLLVSAIGGILLAYSFSATSSDLSVIRTPDGTTIFCENGTVLFGAQGGDLLQMEDNSCDATARKVAIVTRDNDQEAEVGIWGFIVGSLLQVASLKPESSPSSIDSMDSIDFDS